MRDISMERVNETRERILDIIKSPVLTHEQKLTNLACQADYMQTLKPSVFAICPRVTPRRAPVILRRIMENS